MARSNRKSMWDTAANAQTGVNETQPQPNDQPLSPTAVTIMEQLRVAGKKKRDRSWERTNRPMLIRGVPPKLRAAVKEIAGDLDIRIDDVARAFLEFGLYCYQKGEIKFNPILSEQRLTLFPKTNAGWGSFQQPGWIEKLWDFQPQAKKSKSGNKRSDKEKPWKWQVSYRRIPKEIQGAIRQIHQEHDIPLGEVVTLLFGYSLEAYQTGRLVLNPQPDRE